MTNQMIRRPRVGDPGPDDFFDPLDAADFLLDTAPKDTAGNTVLSAEDMSEIRHWLDRAYAKRVPASSDNLWPAPAGSRILVGRGISATDALEKLKALGELTDRGLGRIEQAIERMSDETRSRLDKAEQAIGAISDQAGGRIAELEDRAGLYGRKILELVQARDALAERLAKAEKTISAQGQELLSLNQRLYVDSTGNRITRLESAVAELRRRLENEGKGTATP